MKFNEKVSLEKSVKNHKDYTKNYECGPVYKTSFKEELFLRCATSMFGESKFYTSAGENESRIAELVDIISHNDPEFILKLAYYCRHELNLRSISIALLVEFANSCGVGSVRKSRKYVAETIQRADELTEIIAYQLARNKRIPRERAKIPMMIKHGVADAFSKFDEYQFAKYNRKDADVKLKDVVFLTHPDRSNPLVEKIVNDSLKVPETWEVTLSNWRGIYNSKSEAWEAIVPKMGIFALTRNLRNLLNETVPTDMYVHKFSDVNIIKNSRMLPFRFLTAYSEIENMNFPNEEDKDVVLKGLESAMDISVANLPTLNGVTYVCVDLSYSMEHNISDKTRVTYKDISSLMGSIVKAMSDKSIVAGFADSFKIIPINVRNGVLKNAIDIHHTQVGCATYAYKCIDYLIENKKSVDRIVLLSDMQCYGDASIQSKFAKYHQQINHNVYFYSVDLAGYGKSLFAREYKRPYEKNVALLAGWSDRIFDFIKLYETDRVEQIEYINNIKI